MCGSELEGDRQREIERDNSERQTEKKERQKIYNCLTERKTTRDRDRDRQSDGDNITPSCSVKP